MKKYRVYTHLGVEETVASSPRKALANVRWRLFGSSAKGFVYCKGWEVLECA